MKMYFAPMEGVTGYVFRNVHHKFFPGVDRYFTPFLAPQPKKGLKKKDWKDILPENNTGVEIVPQIITCRADDMISLSLRIHEMGYSEVNLNLGCPSGTVVSGCKGAGFLAYPDRLLAFLDEVVSALSKEGMKLSIKTRIGMQDTDEWEELLAIYGRFPLSELIIHPRLREDYYRKPIHPECYEKAEREVTIPLCYNGDLNSIQDCLRVQERFTDTKRFMFGRGLLREPGLVSALRGEDLSVLQQSYPAYLEAIVAAYKEVLSGDCHVLHKLKEVGSYLLAGCPGFEDFEKRLRQTDHLYEYRLIAKELLEKQMEKG